MDQLNEGADDIVRGSALGAMLLIGLGAGWLFLVGGFLKGVAPESSRGGLLMAAGAAGVVTAVIVAHGAISGAARRVAVGALAQALVALVALCWWLATDFWQGTRHAEWSGVLLVLVILVDAGLVVWAWRISRRTTPS
jgi:hypothetical protein